MSVALDANSAAATITAGATTIDLTNLTVSAGADRVLLATFLVGAAITGLTLDWDALGTPQSMTLLDSRALDASRSVYEFGLVNPTAGNLTLRASWTTSVAADLHATCFTGANQAGGASTFPIATQVSGGGSPATITITTASGNATYSSVVAGNSTFSTPNQNQGFVDNSGVPRGGSQYQLSTGASETHSWATSPAWAFLGTDIVASVAGGGAQSTLTMMGVQ